MIYDKIENLKLYFGMNENFEAIAKFIAENDLKAMECGGYDVSENVKVGISEYEPAVGGNFEAHRDYHDLQYAISGEEAIDVLPIDFARNSTGYSPDIEFFTDSTAAATRVALVEGTFAFLAPADTHKPCIKLGSEKIKKAVFKIKI